MDKSMANHYAVTKSW